jgi:hypothetical protein
MGIWQETVTILIVALAGAHLAWTGFKRIRVLFRISAQPKGVCGSCHGCQSEGSHAQETTR